MREIDRKFLRIIDKMITGDLQKEDLLRDTDWGEMFALAHNNNMESILFDAANSQNGMSDELREQWSRYRMLTLISEKQKLFSLQRILDKAKEKNIELTVFKGCVLADLYPLYALRTSSDTDILVDREDEEKAVSIFTECGYELDEEHSKGNVYVFYNPQYKHMVELHFCLYEDYEGSKIEMLKKMQLDKKESRVKLNVCGMEVTTLGYEEHLIYQLFHIIKHFTVEGVGIRYLTDITLYINRYYDKIDFKDFWNKMKKLGYSVFCEKFFAICVDNFSMDKRVFEHHRCELKEQDYILLLEDLLCKGNIDKDREASWQILGIMTPYLVGNEKVSDNKFIRKMQVLFPSADNLPDEFAYAKRHKWLLPAAWIHKCVRYVIRRTKHADAWYTPNQKLSAAEYRLALVRDTGLTGEK